MLRTKVRLSFLPHKKRLRGIGRSQEQVKLTLQLLGESIAHCKYLDFTFLPFTFLPFEVVDGPGRGKLILRLLREEALHIANPLTLPFYLLPFYLAPISELYK